MDAIPAIPDADDVEIVDLAGIEVDRVDGYMQAAATAHAPRVRVTGADALRIAKLWDSLPPGEQARCHVPPFGLRFVSDSKLFVEASICWRCNNIFGVGPKGPFAYQFDAKAPSSSALLTLLQEHRVRP